MFDGFFREDQPDVTLTARWPPSLNVRSGRCASLLAGVVLLSLGSCDRASSSYATLADARKDRLFERGWLPDILPASTRQIRISNDLDTNHSEGEFSFDPSDFASFATQLKHVGETLQYSAGPNTWTFACDPTQAHCRYSMR